MSTDLATELRTAWDRGVRPSARAAYLTGAYLAGADLTGADLTGTDLTAADLTAANLAGANLAGAYLTGTDLRGANLTAANLAGAYLTGAYLAGTDLTGTNLTRADLTGTYLTGTYLAGVAGGLLRVDGLPSGQATLTPLPAGWHLKVGCWDGTVAALRELIATDEGWPEATGDECARRRPRLLALCDLCDAHIADHPGLIEDLTARWGVAA